MAALAYLAGSIPFGYLIARSQGVDIFKAGSGNIGATNVRRVLGRGPGNLCFALDVLKGLVPTLAAGLALGTLGNIEASQSQVWLWLLSPVAAVVGHMYSPWLGFRGGKGVATGLGALLGVYWVLTFSVLGALVVWLVIVRIWRYVSLGSICAAVSVPVWALVFPLGYYQGFEPTTLPMVVVAMLLAGFVVAKHRANLARILSGTEHRTRT